MKIFGILILASIIFFTNCNTTEPPPADDRKLTLTFEDASCIEAWINITTENIQLPAEINIFINDSLSQISILNTQDSLLYIDSLLPNKTYTIQSFIHSTNQAELSSNELNFTTMDTTSHNFTFETYTFGVHSSSVLYDVAIIDENNIWAVGEIYLLDSLGNQDPQPKNAIKWNGTEWEVIRIPTRTFSGAVVSSQISTIFAFNKNDIWTFSIAGSYSYWNGIKWETEFVYEREGNGNKLWGTSSSDLYLVCNNGGITYYNGINWQKLISGTNLNINSIWGDYNEKNNMWETLAVGGNILQGTERIILKINNTNQVEQISTGGTIEYPLSGVWFKDKIKYYISGDGIYSTPSLVKQWQNLNLPNYYGFSIKGAALNDIIVGGGAGFIGHFNGYSWKNYLEDELNEITGNYFSTAIKGNIIVAVGNTAEGKAIAVIGIR